MELNMNYHRLTRPNILGWRTELSYLEKVSLSVTFAFFIGLMAQMRFYLPWTPIPLTGQTFAVLFGAVLLGKNWGGVSTSLYVGLGAAGVPWFSGWTGGIGALTGATGGYLIGFIVASFFVGYMVDEVGTKDITSMLLVMSFANFVIIYGMGLTYLYIMLGTSPSLWNLLIIGVVPFVVGDIIKVFFSATLSHRLTLGG